MLSTGIENNEVVALTPVRRRGVSLEVQGAWGEAFHMFGNTDIELCGCPTLLQWQLL